MTSKELFKMLEGVNTLLDRYYYFHVEVVLDNDTPSYTLKVGDFQSYAAFRNYMLREWSREYAAYALTTPIIRADKDTYKTELGEDSPSVKAPQFVFELYWG